MGSSQSSMFVARTLASCLSCSSRFPLAVMLFMVATPSHPFQIFPVCKSALDGMGSPAGRGGVPSPPLTSYRLQGAFVCGCAAQNWVLRAKACSLFSRCTSNAQPVSCPNLPLLPAGKRTRTRASGQRGVSHPQQTIADARHRKVHRNGSGQGVRRRSRTVLPWLSAGPDAFCAGLRWHTGGWS